MLKNYTDKYLTLAPASEKKYIITQPKKPIEDYKNWKWIIDKGYLVIDVDGDIGKGSMIKLLTDVGFKNVDLEKVMFVVSKNKGYHLYIELDKDYIINRHYENYPGVEFLTEGSQIMIAGSEGYSFTERKQKSVDRRGLVIYSILDYKGLSKFFESGIKEPVDNTLDFIDTEPSEVISDLNGVSPDCTYETWFKVGTSIYNWNKTDIGFKIWNDWSSKGSSYPGETEMKNKWRAFETNNSNSKNSLATIKSMSRKEVKDSVFSNIYWVKGEGVFYDCSKRETYNTTDFNMFFNHYVEKGGQASIFWSKKEDSLRANGFVFNPRDERTIIPEGNSIYINKFDKNKILQGVNGGKTESVKMFLNHIKGLAGRKYHNDLLHFLAYICQHMGTPKGWAPIIIGDPGIGKTYVYDILRSIFSKEYAYTLHANAIDDKFDDFKNNRILLLFDEVQSKTKKDTYNKLKALITDEELTFEAKGKARKAIKNYMNCMFVSNYNECLTIDANDRRFFVLKVDSKFYSDSVIQHWAKNNNMEDLHPDDIKTKYFEALQETKKNSAEILGYLLNVEIPEDFINSSKAPDTVHKKLLLPTGDVYDHIEKAKEFLKNSKSDYYNETCLVQSYFWEDFIAHIEVTDSERVQFNTTQKGNIFKSLSLVSYRSKGGIVSINNQKKKVFHVSGKEKECDKFIQNLRKTVTKIGNL